MFETGNQVAEEVVLMMLLHRSLAFSPFSELWPCTVGQQAMHDSVKWTLVTVWNGHQWQCGMDTSAATLCIFTPVCFFLDHRGHMETSAPLTKAAILPRAAGPLYSFSILQGQVLGPGCLPQGVLEMAVLEEMFPDYWNGVAGTHFPLSYLHLVEQECVQSGVCTSQKLGVLFKDNPVTPPNFENCLSLKWALKAVVSLSLKWALKTV